MPLREPFSANMGWRTVVGWVIFGLAAIMMALPEGHPLRFLDGDSLKVVLGIAAAWAGISQRYAQKKQMDLQKMLISFMAKAAQAAPQKPRKKGASR